MVSQAELDRERYESRMKSQRDELSFRDYALEMGIAQGLEKGMIQGLEKGMTQGLEKGMTQGRSKGRAETVLRLLTRRYGPIPKALSKLILDTSELEQLDAWSDLVIDCTTLEEFRSAAQL